MRVALFFGGLVLGTSACGGGSMESPPPPPPPAAAVASVTVSPAAETVVPFGAVQLTATLKDASGNELSGRTVTWSSSSDAIANVSNSGLVTGVTLGTVTITAAAEGKSGTAGITVKDGRAVGSSGATVTGLNGTVKLVIPPGALAQLTNITLEAAQGLPAEPRLVAGTAVEIGPAGTTFAQAATLTIRYNPANLPAGSHPDSLTLDTYSNQVWVPVAGYTVDTAASSIGAQLTHLSTYGALTPGTVGRIDVIGRNLRDVVTAADICVSQGLAVRAALSDATGNPLDLTNVTAASSDARIATVKPYTDNSLLFLFRGIAPGTATITFTSGTVTQQVTARVITCARPTILTTSNKDGNLELYRYQGGTLTNLTNNAAADELGRVSPDGSTIGFQSDRVGGETKLYLMDPNGANVRPLLGSQGFQRELGWAPGGNRLVGIGPKSNGKPGVYLVNSDGTGATLLTPGLSTEEGFPVVSPGGQYIAFQQRDVSGSTPGPFHIEVMNSDGTGARQLIDPGTGSDVTPAFSPVHPQNPEMVFVRNFSDGTSWVMRVRYNGTQAQVINGGGADYLPSFCADGEHVMYVHSNTRDVAPFAIVVQDAFLSGAEGAFFYIVPGLQQYIQATYYPRPTNPTVAYGCLP